MGTLKIDDTIHWIQQELTIHKESEMGKEGEWIKDHLREFADRLEQSVVERERERAAVICHAMRDIEYPAMEIAERIMGRVE